MEQHTTYRGFKELNCWKEGRVLRNQIYKLTKSFPDSEKYLLTSQLIRASRSITNNISEGYGRYTYSDTRHFFIESRGSVTEIIDDLTIAVDENYIDEETSATIESQCEKVFKLLNGYIAYLDKANKNK
ncbi:MAG: four helix bundle protein [Chitinophagales bacterium]